MSASTRPSAHACRIDQNHTSEVFAKFLWPQRGGQDLVGMPLDNAIYGRFWLGSANFAKGSSFYAWSDSPMTTDRWSDSRRRCRRASCRCTLDAEVICAHWPQALSVGPTCQAFPAHRVGTAVRRTARGRPCWQACEWVRRSRCSDKPGRRVSLRCSWSSRFPSRSRWWSPCLPGRPDDSRSTRNP